MWLANQRAVEPAVAMVIAVSFALTERLIALLHLVDTKSSVSNVAKICRHVQSAMTEPISLEFFDPKMKMFGCCINLALIQA